MASLNDSMTITTTALTHTSKELIDQREFDNTSVVTVGSPSILSGVVSSFSATSYFEKEGLNFLSAAKVEIDVNGTYLSSAAAQVLFTVGNESSSVFKVVASANSVSALVNDSAALTLPVTLNHEDSISLKVQVTTSTINLLVFVNTDVYEGSATGVFSDVLKDGYTLYIGSDPLSSKLFWEGSIDLKDLTIKVDGNQYFSTGILKGYTFTKVLVSDGTVELTDSSYAILNHVVECPLEEITRNGNNILLKATLDEGSSLSVQEVGIYCSDGSQTILFSTISGLGIFKSTDLEYSLILHMNLDVNVVNTTIVPEIIIKKEDSVSTSDFEKVRRGFMYMTSNLERMVKENSMGLGNYRDFEDLVGTEEGSTTSQTYTKLNPLDTESIPHRTMTDSKPSGIGYNKAQVDYKKQRDLNIERDSYNAVLDYSKVQERFQLLSEKVFSDTALTKVGSVVLNSKGEASVFSEVDYVKATASIDSPTSFDLTISFKADSTLVSDGTICCLANDSTIQPLTLSLRNDMIHLTVGQEEEMVVTIDGNPFTYVRGAGSTQHSGSTYYMWTYSGLNDVPLKTLYTTVVTPTTASKLYTTDFAEYTGTISAVVSSTLIDEDIIKASIGTKQYIRVTFDGNSYRVYVKSDKGDYVLFSTLITPIKVGKVKEILFGIGYTGDSYADHFYGTIYLADFNFTHGSSTLDFLKDKVTNSTVLQDYYHIPTVEMSYYDVPNLNYFTSDYSINIQENVIQGRKDNIAFDNKGGFSLSIKAKLVDTSNKVILSKIVPDAGAMYFAFETKDNSIVFTLYAQNATVILKKELSILNFRRYLNYWSLFTVTYEVVGTDSALCKLYMNKELLASQVVAPLTFSTSNYKLANYLEEKSEVEQNYVSDILSFTGTLSDNDLFYLCNILDTNF